MVDVIDPVQDYKFVERAAAAFGPRHAAAWRGLEELKLNWPAGHLLDGERVSVSDGRWRGRQSWF